MSERIAVLVPCYKRPEYTRMCIDALEDAQHYENTTFFLVDDGSEDETESILVKAKLPSVVVINKPSIGLRATILKFFEFVKDGKFDYISKVDNDCLVSLSWLRNLIDILKLSGSDIISPNVMPSNAAYTYGKEIDETLPYLISDIVGGLWTMRADLIEDIYFEPLNVKGIKGAWPLLNQILIEKLAKCIWAKKVTFEDMGHWSGLNQKHIKSDDHADYSEEIGRKIPWKT